MNSLKLWVLIPPFFMLACGRVTAIEDDASADTGEISQGAESSPMEVHPDVLVDAGSVEAAASEVASPPPPAVGSSCSLNLSSDSTWADECAKTMQWCDGLYIEGALRQKPIEKGVYEGSCVKGCYDNGRYVNLGEACSFPASATCQISTFPNGQSHPLCAKL